MGVKANSKIVLFALYRHSPDGPGDSQRGRYTLDGSELFKRTGVDPTELNDAVEVLEQAKHVDVEHRGARAPFAFATVDLTATGRAEAEELGASAVVYPEGRARLVLDVLHARYLKLGHFRWAISPDDAELVALGLTNDERLHALQRLVAAKYAEKQSAPKPAFVFTVEGSKAATRTDLLDDELPLPAGVSLPGKHLPVPKEPHHDTEPKRASPDPPSAPPPSLVPTPAEGGTEKSPNRDWIKIAIPIAILVAVGGAIYYLNRPLPPPPIPVPDRDPCTELDRRIEELRADKRAQARKLSALVGDAGLQVEGTDSVEETVRTTYATLDEKAEACRLLHVSMQCADKRSPGGPLALKLAEAVVPICGSGGGGPAPPGVLRDAAVTDALAAPAPRPATPLRVVPASSTATSGPATQAAPTCITRCDGTGDGTRLRLQAGKTYRFVLKAKNVGGNDEFHVMSVNRDANIMLVEKNSTGDSFSVGGDDSLKVCSKLHRTGGGCHWMCSVDLVAGTARLFTNEMSADFAVTCQ